MNPEISYQDKLVGTSASIGSLLANRVLAVSDFLSITHPDHPRVRWQLSRLPASAIEKWITFEGNPAAGRTPDKYPDVGILQLNKQIAEAMPVHYEGRLAVAYALGQTALMVGTLKSGDIFQPSEDNPDLVCAAMRIGRGDMNATVGVLTRFGSFIDMSRHVSAGPRMPREELPPSIPLV